MANKIINQRQNIMHNTIGDQRLTYANQLNIQDWNNIINVLKTQANMNATYIANLHDWLVGKGDEVFYLPDNTTFVEYVLEHVEGMETSILNILNKNSVDVEYVGIGISTEVDSTSDTQVPTSKAVGKLVYNQLQRQLRFNNTDTEVTITLANNTDFAYAKEGITKVTIVIPSNVSHGFLSTFSIKLGEVPEFVITYEGEYPVYTFKNGRMAEDPMELITNQTMLGSVLCDGINCYVYLKELADQEV